MHERDRDGTFPHCRCHPLDIAGAHIADCKNSRQTRFQEIRRAALKPARCGQVLYGQIRSRLDKTILITHDTAIEPTGSRLCTGHEKDMPNVVSFDAGGLVAPVDTLEMLG